MTPVLVHCAPAWKDELHRHFGPKRRVDIRRSGNVAFLPPPIAGYRIRHVGTEAVVEIKCRRAAAMELARCQSADIARQLIGSLSHRRPFLGEFREAAA